MFFRENFSYSIRTKETVTFTNINIEIQMKYMLKRFKICVQTLNWAIVSQSPLCYKIIFFSTFQRINEKITNKSLLN